MKRRQGNITKRGKDTWQLKFEVTSSDGSRKTRYATARGSYQKAQQELTRLLRERDKGALPDPTNATVAEYLRAWLASSTKQGFKTLERYHQLADGQIIPHLGATKLQKLTVEAVRLWHRALLDSGLASRTVGHAHRLLKLVLASAVKAGTLTRNVAAVEAPPKVETKEIEVLNPDQITAVLTALEGHSLYPIVSLALATGMRRGELLALQWRDVDLDARAVRVERAIEETRKHGLRVKPPKSVKARRTIKLPSNAVTVLRAHKVQQLELRLQIGMGKPGPDAWVFTTIEGTMIPPDNLSNNWHRICRARGLPLVTFHALRHTHASALIREGVDILTISRRLGHSKASITLDVYGHLIGGADEAAALAIEKAMKK
jgi:integrase